MLYLEVQSAYQPGDEFVPGGKIGRGLYLVYGPLILNLIYIFTRNGKCGLFHGMCQLENNAEYKGFDTENMKIAHISAYTGRMLKGMMPRAHGRATDKNKYTTDIEIVLEEVE